MCLFVFISCFVNKHYIFWIKTVINIKFIHFFIVRIFFMFQKMKVKIFVFNYNYLYVCHELKHDKIIHTKSYIRLHQILMKKIFIWNKGRFPIYLAFFEADSQILFDVFFIRLFICQRIQKRYVSVVLV